MLAISNLVDYGGASNNMEYVYVSTRSVSASGVFNPGNISTFIQHRRLGFNSVQNAASYGLVNNGNGVEVWVATPKFFGNASIQKLASTSNVEYHVEAGSTAMSPQSAPPGGVVWVTPTPVYDGNNTTKASDGTLKAASPVARIAPPDSTTRPDIDEDDFEWCGYGVANSEAHGIEIIRDGVGVYRVTGAKSLASSGWRLLPPRDPDGSGDLGVVTAEQVDDEIIVSLFRRKMVLVDGEIVIQPGEPIDVPANSWIDIRLDMPESAIPPEPQSEPIPIQPE